MKYKVSIIIILIISNNLHKVKEVFILILQMDIMNIIII